MSLSNELKETAEALRQELSSSILKKIDLLRDKIVSGERSKEASYLQTLINIDDELEDVLLNFENNEIDLDIYSINRADSDLDDDGEY